MKPLHIVDYHKSYYTGEWVCKCSCGATWTQDGKRTQEELDDIYDRHVRIFEKRIEVL